MNLAGSTIVLENTDALGVNNRRAYKNVPFVVSSRPYGLFIHTSRHTRLSLADVSTRALQGRRSLCTASRCSRLRRWILPKVKT